MPGPDDPERRRRTPDALDLGGAELSAQPAWPGEHVMVRGPYPPERTGLPFILPALAHC